MASREPTSEASAAASTSSSRVAPPNGTGSPSVSRFSVRVPVLSEQSTSMPAISSMDSRRATMALLRDSARAPTAIVTDRTAGIATGMAATVSTSANWSSSTTGSCR